MYNPDITLSDHQPSWHIGEEQVGQRVDLFITSILDNMSRTAVQQLIVNGDILVNERASKPGYILRIGDKLQLLQNPARSRTNSAKPRSMPLEIVYEDEDLLVINKAAGMVVHPAPGHADDTLVNALLARYPGLQGVEGLRPGIVHRLDKDTSGLIIVAKNAPAQAALIEQMKQHLVVKRYLALVEGIVSLEQGSIDAPIGRDPRHRQQMAITAAGSREARTHFRVLERFSRHTLLLLELETGRTHQIRVHLKAIGHPIVGDPVYGSGNTRGNLSLRRQFLHAYQLKFTHPTSGKILELEAPLPEDLKAALQRKSSL
ncbi:MAG TPA: RluA family pseudouridine synthase [Ktedonobacteraceae bacterium]|nr:RluA family pseudouridine synthase [Ktedonobacteraceae bacterium]